MTKNSPLKVLALQDKDKKLLCQSASGGAFAVFARAVLNSGGVVFGATIDKNNGAVFHTSISSISQLHLLQGSKYVRSDLRGTFSECLDYLKQGRLVLFCGTPCQVSSILAFMKKNMNEERPAGLLTVDLICHGTPRQELFSAYLKWLEKDRNADGPISQYRFRDKRYGWGLYYSFRYKKNGKEIFEVGSAQDDPYYYAFAKGISYRNGCYKCPFACQERIGDITLGDYWGINKTGLQFKEKDGVSLVLLNTELALSFFEQCKSNCVWAESTFEDAARENANLTHPTQRSVDDALLMKEVDNCLSGFDQSRVFESLLKPSQSKKARIRRAMPEFVRHLIYRMKSLK